MAALTVKSNFVDNSGAAVVAQTGIQLGFAHFSPSRNCLKDRCTLRSSYRVLVLVPILSERTGHITFAMR